MQPAYYLEFSMLGLHMCSSVNEALSLFQLRCFNPMNMRLTKKIFPLFCNPRPTHFFTVVRGKLTKPFPVKRKVLKLGHTLQPWPLIAIIMFVSIAFIHLNQYCAYLCLDCDYNYKIKKTSITIKFSLRISKFSLHISNYSLHNSKYSGKIFCTVEALASYVTK